MVEDTKRPVDRRTNNTIRAGGTDDFFPFFFLNVNPRKGSTAAAGQPVVTSARE